MSERHDPKNCPQCKAQADKLRHPSYARLRRLLVLPSPRGGTA
ncbi:hypothetical protein [Streptomyces chryseus]|nr:hypothetical protein [Streptomyces chryseus]GGX02235.1 hypothetical protein GCM10010353_17430 [Streptomyces chryseus]